MNPALIISLISELTPLATNLFGWISKLTTTLKQSKELTPEQEAELDGYIAQITSSAAFQIEPDPTPPAPPIAPS